VDFNSLSDITTTANGVALASVVTPATAGGNRPPDGVQRNDENAGGSADILHAVESLDSPRCRGPITEPPLDELLRQHTGLHWQKFFADAS
jgi:hypothetical protein